MEKKNVWVVGHKNPDTDSICAAITYANLKNKLEEQKKDKDTELVYTAMRAGSVSPETAYVLDRFGVEAPQEVSDAGTQIKDIPVRRSEGVNHHISMKKAWEMMKEKDVVTLPIIDQRNKLEGLIIPVDNAKSYMDVYDNAILSRARTQYKNIVETLEGKIITGNEHGYFLNGKVVVGAGTPEVVGKSVERDDLVIIGDREEPQLLSIESGCSCLIVTNAFEVSDAVV